MVEYIVSSDPPGHQREVAVEKRGESCLEEKQTFEWKLGTIEVRSCMVGWVTGWWVSVPEVGAEGVVEVVLIDSPILQELVGGKGKETGTESNLGGGGPRVTRLVIRFELDGSGGTLWEGPWGDVGVMGRILGRDVGCGLNNGKNGDVLLGPRLAV